VLDTSALSYIQRGQEPRVSRLKSFLPDKRAVTVITMEEQLRGRIAQIAKANQKSDLSAMIYAYAKLEEAVAFFHTVQVLSFNQVAANHYIQLRRTYRRIGTNDLRIAAIALSINGVIVTANVADFRPIQGLEIEDWSVQ
jgi:tRNA(fMet)-specific endonuclease VapC